MGKKLGAGSSWLSGVRRAFRSPSSKDHHHHHHSNYCPRTGSGHDQDQYHDHEDNKKREKRRWVLLRRGSSRSNNNIIQQCESCRGSLGGEQRHAIAVAAAKAAVDFIRLTSTPPPPSTSLSLLHYAAIVIQTAFRGYLARRALQALKGIVKLQALVRGHNVRKQTKMTFQCMQLALLRVQSRVRDQRSRASHESTRKSMFAESTNLWESTYMRDIRERKSTQSRAGSWIPDDWEDCPRTLEELDVRQQARKEKTLAYALSQQIWDTSKDPYVGNEKGLQEAGDWLDRWIATKQSESHKRYSSDRRETVKTLEIDTSMPYCYSSPIVSRSQCQTTPQHRRLAPVTPSPAKMKLLQSCSASPRGQRERRRSYSTASTPSFASARCSRNGLTRCSNDTPADSVMPNYMAATESAKARVRSQSVTRQRPSTPERERGGSVKKRLSYPVHDIYRNFGIGCNSFNEKLKSPSFKSVQAGRMRIEQGSNLSSCCADSVGGEISPCSTTDLRGWLR